MYRLLLKCWVFFTSIYLGKNNDNTLCQIVGTLPNKGNNNGTVLQDAIKRESQQKQTKHFLFQILSFYFEELKKPNSNITGHTVSALLTEELLEKIMLAKNNGTVLQDAIKRESQQKQTKPIRSSII
jgi:hypothetical protein